MEIKDLLRVETINLDLESNNKKSVLDEMIGLLDADGVISNKRKFKKDIEKRESLSSTGIGFGIAIPHAKSKYVNEARVAVGISKVGIEYGSIDGTKVNLVFMIAVPDGKNDLHLTVLANLARKLIHEEFREKILNSKNKVECMEKFL